MSASPRYRAGIIGCGTIARTHAGAFSRRPQVELVALADIRPEAMQALAAAHQVPPHACYTEALEMLARSGLDIVSICTWPGLHAPMTIAAAQANVKAVICEKPLAPDLAQADQMLSACAARGVKLIVSHQHRFNAHCEEARRQIESGAIGIPQFIHLQTARGLLNNGSHHIDMARFVLGDPAWDWVLGHVP